MAAESLRYGEWCLMCVELCQTRADMGMRVDTEKFFTLACPGKIGRRRRRRAAARSPPLDLVGGKATCGGAGGRGGGA